MEICVLCNPILDGRLPDNSRVNANIFTEISSRGPTFTIRKLTSEPWSQLNMQFKTVSPEILAYLWLMIEYESNFVIIGGTGSGKTSLLNSLAFSFRQQRRVVSIEDTHELSLCTKTGCLQFHEATGVGAEGKFGEVDLFTLLKSLSTSDYVM